ncbi:MAG: hypothetical protein LBL86_07280 [Coriobacteriales bacterium]|jgi:hypothetical protein|nr:hypothetical protein [Coriobacteriales bacterium]
MEKLTRELRDFLYEISPHSGERHYLRIRFGGLPCEDVFQQTQMVVELRRKGMLHISEPLDSVEFVAVPPEQPPAGGIVVGYADGGTRTVSFPPGFTLTSDGRSYRKEARKQAALWVLGIVLTAVLSGFFAWVFVAVVPW